MHAALFFGGAAVPVLVPAAVAAWDSELEAGGHAVAWSERRAAVPGHETEIPVVETSKVLATAEDRVVEEAAATLERRHQAHHHAVSPEERRRNVRDLFELVVQCVHEDRTEPIIASSRQIAANRFEAGFDIAEIQGTFNVDAQKAKDWLVVNHLVESAELEEFTLGMAAAMASKSPMAIAVIKEQLRVLMDYQPIAALVYERIQGLRREAYDSSDYLEGLKAFSEKRPPIFRGT